MLLDQNINTAKACSYPKLDISDGSQTVDSLHAYKLHDHD